MQENARPLDGIRVLEVGQLLAGPFTGSILAYYGAEVIKVEPPGDGDPIRSWRILDDDGTSFWWRSLGRNKKCITANLRNDQGRELVRRLARKCNVLIENFRPGVMEKWGLGPVDLWIDNPGLIYARISGYGQDGPYASKPGFASVCEGVGGLRYVNGKPGEAPMRPNLSLGDTMAGLHTALGIVMACLHQANNPGSKGQVGYFDPKKQKGFDKLPDDHPLKKRYEQRKKEYADNLEMTFEQLVSLAANWNSDYDQANSNSPKDITIFEINDKSASAKLTAMWGIDYFHLSKVDGVWKISSPTIPISWLALKPKATLRIWHAVLAMLKGK